MKKGIEHWKARGLDFSKIFAKPMSPAPSPRRQVRGQDHGLDKALDHKLIAKAKPALEARQKVEIEIARSATEPHRRHHAVAKSPALWPRRAAGRHHHGEAHRHGRPELRRLPARGVTLDLTGEANDYVGKGLSGGKIIVRPHAKPSAARRRTSSSATPCSTAPSPARCYFRGVGGERFAVRNSGAASRRRRHVGDHGCEYMTGGTVWCSANRPQLRGRHVRRRRLCAGRGRQLREALQPRHGRPAARPGRRSDAGEAASLTAGDLHNHGLVDITSQMDRKDAERVWELLVAALQVHRIVTCEDILDNWVKPTCPSS
jgi:hypothetical protein